MIFLAARSMIEHFLTPLNADDLFHSGQRPGCIGHHIRVNTSGSIDLDDTDIAIIGITDVRLDGLNKGASMAPGQVRKHFYSLMKPQALLRIYDLGNVEAGETVHDTLFAVYTVLNELMDRDITVILLGGSKNLAFEQFRISGSYSKKLELALVDKSIDLRENTFLNKIVLHEPNFLFNVAAIGYQTYLTEQESLDAMERMYFDCYRLGHLRENITHAEAILRNAHLVMFDVSAIRQGDSPAFFDPSPNGLRSEEACQLAKYAGLGNQLRSIGFYECNPEHDINGQSSRLVAQLLWFFIEGFYQKKKEDPQSDQENFLKYRIGLKNGAYEIAFYKSKSTDRWWMEVPNPKSNRENTIPIVVPCTYDDYLVACNDEMPDKWWRIYQKFT